jgi:hypothetical protein
MHISCRLTLRLLSLVCRNPLLLRLTLALGSGSLCKLTVHPVPFHNICFHPRTHFAGGHPETGTGSEEHGLGKRRLLQTTPTASGGMFCVAKEGADPTALQVGLNWACGPGHGDPAGRAVLQAEQPAGAGVLRLQRLLPPERQLRRNL